MPEPALETPTSDVSLIDVLPQHRFDAAPLWQYLQQHLDDFSQPSQLRRVSRWAIQSHLSDRDPHQEVRAAEKAAGQAVAVGAFDRARISHLRALPDTEVPVPPARVLCEDPSIIGTPFYVMDHVEGRVITGVHLPNLTPSSVVRFTSTTRASRRSCMVSTTKPVAWGISASPKVTSRVSWIAGANNIWRRRPKRTPT